VVAEEVCPDGRVASWDVREGRGVDSGWDLRSHADRSEWRGRYLAGMDKKDVGVGLYSLTFGRFRAWLVPGEG
jgi:hypothetical protein